MATSTSLTLSPAPSTCSLETFTQHYGDVYEHSPWVAEAAWKEGLSNAHDAPDATGNAENDVHEGQLSASPVKPAIPIRLVRCIDGYLGAVSSHG